MELRDDQEPIGVVGVNDVAGIHEAQPDSPGDRRGDPRIHQLQLGSVDLPLIRLDDPFRLANQGLLGIQLLFRDQLLPVEIPVTLQIELGVLQQRLIARHLAFHLGQLRLEGAGIDFSQQFAASDDLALFKQHPHQLSVDAAFYGDRVERGD